jgi:protein-S-isoprenylcysteine O-methyltransferase
MDQLSQKLNGLVNNSPHYTETTGVAFHTLVGYFLGAVLGIGVMLFLYSPVLYDLGAVVVFISLFHFWEYNFVAIFRGDDLTHDSFLLNHSTEFGFAFVTAFTEYFIELYFWPNMKKNKWCVFIGVVIMLIGQSLRTVSMYTCGSNFNHQIEDEKRSDHQLVTHGVYNYLRHPSYFGWFWWCIAIQITLMNPISICTWAAASWWFFNRRIRYEEKTLREQFSNYAEYAQRVPTGIPFIK